MSSAEFLRRMAQHLALVRNNLEPQGLRGYIVIANENYEVAYLNWSSQKAMERAFATPQGQVVRADEAELLNPLMYAPALSFQAGDAVQAGQAYSTLSH